MKKLLLIFLFPIFCQAQMITHSYRHYCEEYKAVLVEALSQGWLPPTDLQKRRDNNGIVYFKANGIWTKFDVFFGITGNSDFARIDWKNPSGTKLTLSGALSFSATNGWTGDGANYIDTGWVPNSSSKFLQNSGAIGYAISIGSATTGMTDVGAGNDASLTNGLAVNTRNGANQMVLRLNQTTSATPTTSHSDGRYILQRTASNAWAVFRTGASIFTGTNASTGRTTQPIYLLASNSGGSAAGFSTRTINLFFAGEVLTGLESTLDTGLILFK